MTVKTSCRCAQAFRFKNNTDHGETQQTILKQSQDEKNFEKKIVVLTTTKTKRPFYFSEEKTENWMRQEEGCSLISVFMEEDKVL